MPIKTKTLRFNNNHFVLKVWERQLCTDLNLKRFVKNAELKRIGQIMKNKEFYVLICIARLWFNTFKKQS